MGTPIITANTPTRKLANAPTPLGVPDFELVEGVGGVAPGHLDLLDEVLHGAGVEGVQKPPGPPPPPLPPPFRPAGRGGSSPSRPRRACGRSLPPSSGSRLPGPDLSKRRARASSWAPPRPMTPGRRRGRIALYCNRLAPRLPPLGGVARKTDAGQGAAGGSGS